MVALVVGPNAVDLEMNCPQSLQKMQTQQWRPKLGRRRWPDRWTSQPSRHRNGSVHCHTDYTSKQYLGHEHRISGRF